MNFQTNARKGNTSGKAALGGCLFLLAAVYFDYLVLDSAFLEPTLPRIRVWDDNAICSYSGAELGIQNIEFKPMEETLFNKHQMALASIRGFDITGWDQPPIKSTSHAPCNATNNQPEFCQGQVSYHYEFYVEKLFIQMLRHLSIPPLVMKLLPRLGNNSFNLCQGFFK